MLLSDVLWPDEKSNPYAIIGESALKMKLAVCKLEMPLPVILVTAILWLLSGQMCMRMILDNKQTNKKPKPGHCLHITNFVRKHLKGKDTTGLKAKNVITDSLLVFFRERKKKIRVTH